MSCNTEATDDRARAFVIVASDRSNGHEQDAAFVADDPETRVLS